MRVDEAANAMYYMARDGDNYMKFQLHRVGLDGKNDKRLTDPAFTHTVSLSPDGKYFVDVAETHDQAPVTRLVDANGKVVGELAKTDLTKFNELGLKKVEMYTYQTADGKATLHGMIHFPSNFDPTQEVSGARERVRRARRRRTATSERFPVPNALTEYGFIVLNVEARTNPGHGHASISTPSISSSARPRWTTWPTA